MAKRTRPKRPSRPQPRTARAKSAKASKKKGSRGRPARPATRARAARKAPVRRAGAKKPSPKSTNRKRVTPARKIATKAPGTPRSRAGRSPVPKPQPTRPALDRERRQLSEEERSSQRPEIDDRMIAAARTGHNELVSNLERHTETSPKLTAGDLDARWEDAYAVGDEAPGGDNPTPEQDRVDDIGRALGVTYQDDEELVGSDKVAERDRHRWELDPASSDDWPHRDDE